jgi:hypothetical protein
MFVWFGPFQTSKYKHSSNINHPTQNTAGNKMFEPVQTSTVLLFFLFQIKNTANLEQVTFSDKKKILQ